MAKKKAEIVDQLLDPSKKFIAQLNKLFAQETVDLNHISERIQAALVISKTVRWTLYLNCFGKLRVKRF
jgi:hypothetical protein